MHSLEESAEFSKVQRSSIKLAKSGGYFDSPLEASSSDSFLFVLDFRMAARVPPRSCGGPSSGIPDESSSIHRKAASPEM